MNLIPRKLLAVGALFAAIITSSAHALTLNSPGVVGVVDIKLANADVSTEIVAAQKLLDMLANTTFGTGPHASGLYDYQTSSTEYAGTLTGGLQTTNYGITGYEYGFAKYDGDNAGYVLFYLGGAAANTVIPTYPATLWTNKPEQYAISHLTVFNSTTFNTPGVPDGGTTAVLLGCSLVALGAIARRRRTL